MSAGRHLKVILPPDADERLRAFAPPSEAPEQRGARTPRTLLLALLPVLELAHEASGLPEAEVIPWLAVLAATDGRRPRLPLPRLAELAPDVARPILRTAWVMGLRRVEGGRRATSEVRTAAAASVLDCAPEDVAAAVARIPGLAAELTAL